MAKINVRAKGQRGEREVANLFIALMETVEASLLAEGIPVKPYSQSLRRNAAQWDAGGHDIVGIPGLAVEVKRVETEFQAAWWVQALDQGKRVGALPALFYRRSRRPWRVMTWAGIMIDGATGPHWLPASMSGDDFLTAYGLAYKNRLTKEAELAKVA